jgi:hypothetical protein
MQKIRYRIAFGILLVSLFSALIIGIHSIVQSIRFTQGKELQGLVESASNLGKELEKEMLLRIQLTNAVEGVLNATLDTENNIGDPKKIIEYKKKFSPIFKTMAKESGLLSLWIVFSPEVNPKGTVISYWFNKENNTFFQEEDYSVNELDLNSDEMKWWTDAIKLGETWTFPYYWPHWDMELISYSRSIYHDSTHIACIGSDFGFDELRKRFKELKFYSSGYAFLSDNNLNLAIHPSIQGQNLTQVFSEKETERILNVVSNKKSGLHQYIFRGGKKNNGLLSAFQ